MHQLFAGLGLSAKETQTFLKLLELGAQPVSVAAKHVGVPRTTMYFILERLRVAGLVEEFERSGIRYAKSVPVESIGDVLRAQEKKAKDTVELFERHLPQLKARESTLSITPKVRFAEDRDAVEKLYASVGQDDECCAYFNPATVGAVMPGSLDAVPKLAKKSDGSAREMLVDCPEAHTYRAAHASPAHRIKILPDACTFLSDCIILPDRLVMIVYGENQISGIEIFSASLAQTQKSVFDRLWETVAD